MERGGSHSDDNHTHDHKDEEITLYLKVMKTVAVKIKKHNTIGDLKTKLQSMEGVAKNLQKLFFAGNYLKDNELLADYSIPDGSTLNMYLSSELGMQIFVEMPTGRKISLNVKNSDTIQSIKHAIEDMEGISQERQTLVFGGRSLEDTHTLSIYNITASSVLHMILQESEELLITVNLTKVEVITLLVRTWFTVWDVKTMIKSKKQIPQEQQKLIFDGKQLKNNIILSAYNIQYKSVLHLSYPMQISVHCVDTDHIISLSVNSCDTNRTISLSVNSCDAVSDLKKKIQKKFGIPPDQQTLLLDGICLRSDRNLGDNHVEDGCTVDLFLEQRGGTTASAKEKYQY